MGRHGDWMRAAAIAYGLVCCGLLGSLALLAAMALSPRLQAGGMAVIGQWMPQGGVPLEALVSQLATEWPDAHRWSLLVVPGGIAIALWLKGVGATQHGLRTVNAQTAPTHIALSQRLGTVALAVGAAGLLALAYGILFAQLPPTTDSLPESFMTWGKQTLTHGLRWSLALSTIALLCGLVYRSSGRPTRAPRPILPGTLLATVIWGGWAVLLKLHIAALPTHHWLFAILSTLAVGLLASYGSIIGLLSGGRLNRLVGHGVTPLRSPPPPPPPPSFESFTIQRRSDRWLR